MNKSMIYDIRTKQSAIQTLINLTGVPISRWIEYLPHENEYEYIEHLVEEVIKKYGQLPNSYEDLNFVFFHVTTSSNECSSLKRYGILDLQQSYLCKDSELRCFLENHGIFIDLDEHQLLYLGNKYDIGFSVTPRENTEEYKCWLVGRKFYYDYTVCGFLSVWERSAYGGGVHYRPEILNEIDNLLKLDLSREWEETHSAYEIIAKVHGDKIIYFGYDDESEEDKMLNFLTKAYITAYNDTSENILLLKNGVQIPPSNILEINPFSHWI